MASNQSEVEHLKDSFYGLTLWVRFKWPRDELQLFGTSALASFSTLEAQSGYKQPDQSTN